MGRLARAGLPPLFGLLALAVLAAALRAEAPERGRAVVVVFAAAKTAQRPGFVEALRIQLAGTAGVEVGGVLPAGTSSERADAAIERMRGGGARLAAWVEGPFARTDGQRELVLYLVGRRRGRAVMEVVRMPAGAASEASESAVDRSLALKVREVLGDLAAATDVLGAGLPRAAVRVARGRESSPPVAQLIVEVGPALATASGSLGWRPGAVADLGARFGGTEEAPALDAVARLRFLGAAEDRRAVGRVSVGEIAPGFELRAHAGLGALRLGGHAAVDLRLVAADGVTARGEVGSRLDLVPALAVGPLVGVRLSPALELRLAVALELALVRQRYALDAEAVTDLGRVRGAGALTFVMVAP